MLFHELDLQGLVLVGWFEFGGRSDEDSQPLIQTMAELKRAADASGGMVRILVYVGLDQDRPSASNRKGIADGHAAFQKARVSTVTQNTVARGVMRAVGWLTPAREGFKQEVHATCEDALAWFEKDAGAALPALRAAVAKVQAQVTAQKQRVG